MDLNVELIAARASAQLMRTGHLIAAGSRALGQLSAPGGLSGESGVDENVASRSTGLEPDIEGVTRSWQGVARLFSLHDEQFVKAAYRVILRREPDPEGFAHFLGLLRRGEASKVNIVFRIFRSAESRRIGRTPSRLWLMAAADIALRIPIAGYMLDLCQSLVRLPSLKRGLAITDLHQYAQIGRLDHLAVHAIERVDKVSESVDERLSAYGQRLTQCEGATPSRDLEALVARLQQQVGDLRRELVSVKEHPAYAAHDPEIDGIGPLVGALRQAGSREVPERFINGYFEAHADEFRGERSEIARRLSVYLPALFELPQPSFPVVDLGSGRGEWLELLAGEGIECTGFESNRRLAAGCQGRGLPVQHKNLWNGLSELVGDSVRAVTGFHVVEHVPFEQQLAMMIQAYRVIVQGGVLILETPDPTNLRVGSCDFYLDPTHRNPIPSKLLLHMAQFVGFGRVELWKLNAAEEDPGDKAQQDDVSALYAGPRDYAILAYKE